MAQEGHSPVLVFDSPVMVLHSLVLVFTQSSFNFTQSSFIFLRSPVLIFRESSFIFLHSPVLFLHSPVLFFTQSSFIFCVVTRPLSRCCNTCYLTAAILYFLATMDSIIRQAVRDGEELRRSNSSRSETASSTNQLKISEKKWKRIRCGWIITKFVLITNSGPFVRVAEPNEERWRKGKL